MGLLIWVVKYCYYYYFLRQGFTMLVRLVLNSRPQVIHPPWPSKCLITGVSHHAQPKYYYYKIGSIFSFLWLKLFLRFQNVLNTETMLTLNKKRKNQTFIKAGKKHNSVCSRTATRPGTVAHACNPGTLGGQSGQITWGQEFKTSLANMAKPHLHYKYKN